LGNGLLLGSCKSELRSGIASGSFGVAEDGRGGNVVNVKGEEDPMPGDVGNGWCIGGIIGRGWGRGDVPVGVLFGLYGGREGAGFEGLVAAQVPVLLEDRHAETEAKARGKVKVGY
jgi:hypothetical protein